MDLLENVPSCFEGVDQKNIKTLKMLAPLEEKLVLSDWVPEASQDLSNQG